MQNNIPPLNHLYFYLTQGCNLACRHCWLAPKLDPDGTNLPTLSAELFKTAIREAEPLGLTNVKLTGGEPLLHPQIITLLNFVQYKKLGLTIETNGVLCTPEVASEIAKSPDRFVSISLDGADADTHDLVRGTPGSFDFALQGIRNLVAVDTPPQIIMTIMPHNAGQVDDVVRLAEEIGATSVKFNVLQPTARGKTLHDSGETINVSTLIKLGQYIELELASRTELQIFFDYPLAFRPLSRIGSGGSTTCGIFTILGVIPSGDYALCGIAEHITEFIFGSVGEDSLAAMWQENPILAELRKGLPEHLLGVCQHCLLKYQCLGSCIAQNYYRSESLWSPNWFCEEANSVGLFPKTRLSTSIESIHY